MILSVKKKAISRKVDESNETILDLSLYEDQKLTGYILGQDSPYIQVFYIQ